MRNQRTKRQLAKQKIAEIADKAVHDAFEEAALTTSRMGAPRSSMDFCRWFVDAFNERLSSVPYVKR